MRPIVNIFDLISENPYIPPIILLYGKVSDWVDKRSADQLFGIPYVSYRQGIGPTVLKIVDNYRLTYIITLVDFGIYECALILIVHILVDSFHFIGRNALNDFRRGWRTLIISGYG